MPAGIDLHSSCIDLEGGGDYLSGEFLQCLRRKVALIRESLAQEDLVVWSDVDIFILKPDRLIAALKSEMEHQSADILFQREGPSTRDINAGLFVCRSSRKMRDFWKAIGEHLAARQDWHDQDAINSELLGPNSWSVKWGYLPWSFYARSHGLPPPRDTIVWHANCTKGTDGVGQKMQQIDMARRYFAGNALARLWIGGQMLRPGELRGLASQEKHRLIGFIRPAS